MVSISHFPLRHQSHFVTPSHHLSVLCIITGNGQFAFVTTLEDLVTVTVCKRGGGVKTNGKQEIKLMLQFRTYLRLNNGDIGKGFANRIKCGKLKLRESMGEFRDKKIPLKVKRKFY